MNCPRCGKENDKENLFCSKCGLEFAAYQAQNIQVGEQMFCYRHPKTATLVSCGKCGKPICTKCALLGPAGPRCPECGRVKSQLTVRGVSHDLGSGFRRIFSGGAGNVYIYVLLFSMLLGVIRGCTYLIASSHRQAPEVHSPPPREE